MIVKRLSYQNVVVQLSLCILGFAPKLAVAQSHANQSNSNAHNLTAISLNDFQKATQADYGFRPRLNLKAFDFVQQLAAYVRQEKWLPLFRLMDTDLDRYRNQLLPGSGDVWLTVDDYCQQLVQSLPKDGKRAIQLYVDSRARKAIQTIRSTGDPGLLTSLRRQYYVASQGDAVADLVGDGFFQNGMFLEAYDSWRTILDDHPGSKISEARLLIKQAMALARLGEEDQLRTLRFEIESRFEEEMIQFGDHVKPASQWIDDLISESGVRSDANSNQVVFEPDKYESWKWSLFLNELVGRSSTLPGFAIGSKICLVNLGDRAAGFGSKSGKLLWTVPMPVSSEGRNLRPDLEVRIRRGGLRVRSSQLPRLVPKQFDDPIAIGDRFFVASKPKQSSQPQMLAMDANGGKKIWSTESLTDFQLSSSPIAFNDQIVCLARHRRAGHLCLIALAQKDGSLTWQLDLGSIQSLGISFGPWQMGALVADDHRLVVCISNAVLVVNLHDQSIQWMYRFSDEQLDLEEQELEIEEGANFITLGMRILGYGSPAQEDVRLQGNQVVVFHRKAKRLFCLDLRKKIVAWSRDVQNVRSLACLSDGAAFALSKQNLTCFDLQSGDERWSVSTADNVSKAVQVGGQLMLPTKSGFQTVTLDGKKTGMLKSIPDIEDAQSFDVRGRQAFIVSKRQISLFQLMPKL